MTCQDYKEMEYQATPKTETNKDKPTMPLNVYNFCIMVGSIRHRNIKKEELEQYMKDYEIKSIKFEALTNYQIIETKKGEIFRIDEGSLL